PRQGDDRRRDRLHDHIVLAGASRWRAQRWLRRPRASRRHGTRGEHAGHGRACRHPVDTRNTRAGTDQVVTPSSRRLLAGLALAVAISLSGCGVDSGGAGESATTADDKPAKGDTFIESSIGNISALIPNIANDGASHEVGGQIYNGLVTFDKDLKVVPELAESWTFSADCRRLTFRLRDDVRWHDGKAFTADDVLFTHAAMVHPKTPTPYREDFEAIEKI